MPAWISSLGVWKPLSRMFGHERPGLLAADRRHRRLDQGLARGQLGRLVSATIIRSSKRRAGVDQRDLGVVVLQRLDHGPRVEPERPG